MKTPTQNNRGTTLVELIVCMALLGLFSVATVALIQPCSQAFTQMQQQTRAQNLADSLIERLRGEVMQASGYVRMTKAGEVNAENKIFEYNQASEIQGSAVEFGLESGYVEIVDAGSIAETYLTSPKTTVTAVPGYIHLRYFMPGGPAGSKYPAYNPIPKHRDTPEGTITERNSAYNFTEAYPKNSYMNMTVELEFTVRGHAEDSVILEKGTSNEHTIAMSRVNSMAVLVKVKDAEGKIILTQKGILALPHEPYLVQYLAE